ncbi:MAG: hypothetical protein IKT08_01745 [Bacteroidales bacterium]|nr:hypothetical protein [Bacteroidales bacterium]
MKKILILLIALLAMAFNGYSQGNRFSTDKTQFFEELRAYLTSATSKEDKKAAEVMMQDLQGVWNDRYGVDEAGMVIPLCETMLSKSGNRAYYNLFTFAEALLHAPQSGLSRDDLRRWLSYTSTHYGNRPMKMDGYLKRCRDLFADHVINERGVTQWIVQDASLSFPTDTAFIVAVNQCDLILKTSKDQSVIHNTQGRFLMEENQWLGKGGRVDWSRFGIPEDKVYGIVHDYQINLAASNYRIESIDFYNKDYFAHAIQCSFEDGVTNSPPNEKTMFPKALSHDENVQSGHLENDIDFIGGFGMVGQSVSFFGTGQNQAQLVFRHNRRITLRMLAKRFILKDDNLVSNEAAVRIYLYDSITHSIDSIYHNDLGFRYDMQKDKVLLYRRDNGVGAGPYHDTYHAFDIFLEAIYWDRNTDLMDFRRLEGTSGVSEGVISSVNYFRKSDYLKIQALDKKHPMEHINKFLQLYGDEFHRFNINDLVGYLKYPLSQVTSLILNLQSEGYLEYDKDTQTVTVLDRFFDVLASDHQEFDFDVIRFQTRATNRQPNIRLVLNTNDMMVFGIWDDQTGSEIPSITLSDFKHVVILPDDARVVLKKNRNFNFSGCIMAGMYEFFTKDCLFDYSTFSIEMKKVDSLRFYARFDGKVYPVEGTLERLKGTLEIDEKDNKSSVRQTPDYPRFHCPGHSYKFYRDINGGVFDLKLPLDSVTDEFLADKFYYCLEPFSVNSLDNLNSEDISFKGHLVSGGIFPDITEPLVVMDDHSLGFKHTIGNGKSDSYPMYGGQGNFHQEVFLSNEGFFGQGVLNVETADYTAPRFDLYLDSVTADVQQFAMRERSGEVPFPKASCGPLELKWDLSDQLLYTTTKVEPICMFDSTYFRGVTMLSNQGYHGDGELTFGLTRFNSNYFDFESHSFVADSSDFVLYDEDGSTKAFLAENYRSLVNLASKKVQYQYLDMKSNLDFPLNKFYCSLQEAEWDMDANTIHLFSPSSSFADYAAATTHDELLSIHNAASKFVSMLPEHDSLEFFCSNADYNMNDYVIHAHDVKIIRVADAALFPSDANLDIMRNAEITPLEHASVLADTLNRQHLYKDASVTIFSRNRYLAEGTKDYLDMEGVATPVYFDKIEPVDGVTVGHAVVADSLEFLLSPYFGFQGKVVSTASSPHDRYEGSFRLTQSCLGDTVWFVSTAEIDPERVSIPIDMDKIRKVRPGLFNGLCYEFGSGGGYRANFLKPMNSETVMVLMQSGDLSYEVDSSRYVIKDSQRTDYRLSLSDRCVVKGHGATNLGFDEGLTKMTCYGDYTGFPNDSLVMDVLNVFQVPIFNEQLLKDMAEIYAAVEGEAVDLTKTGYVDYLRMEQGEEAAALLRQEIELNGYPEIEANSFYDRMIVIPNLHLVWNPVLRAFVSQGKIGIGSFGTNVVNRYVDGYVVFDRRLGVITYFFEHDLFMTYISYNCGDGQLQIHATWGTVNSQLSDMKEKMRSVKSGNYYFEYVVTPYEAITGFLSRLKRAGLR